MPTCAVRCDSQVCVLEAAGHRQRGRAGGGPCRRHQVLRRHLMDRRRAANGSSAIQRRADAHERPARAPPILIALSRRGNTLALSDPRTPVATAATAPVCGVHGANCDHRSWDPVPHRVRSPISRLQISARSLPRDVRLNLADRGPGVRGPRSRPRGPSPREAGRWPLSLSGRPGLSPELESVPSAAGPSGRMCRHRERDFGDVCYLASSLACPPSWPAPGGVTAGLLGGRRAGGSRVHWRRGLGCAGVFRPDEPGERVPADDRARGRGRVAQGTVV